MHRGARTLEGMKSRRVPYRVKVEVKDLNNKYSISLCTLSIFLCVWARTKIQDSEGHSQVLDLAVPAVY